MRNFYLLKLLFADYLKKIFHLKRENIKSTWEKTPKKINNLVNFLAWFDETRSLNETINKSAADWSFRFKGFKYFRSLKKDIALEIGFGGGRLILNACKDFRHVYGIDVHENFQLTRDFLNSQGCYNFTLFNHSSLSLIPLSSVDFVYSFIVFQHFDSMEEVSKYLNLIKKLLNDKGVAHIYFGKTNENNYKIINDKNFNLRDVSLVINPEYFKKIISKDFHVLDVIEDIALVPSVNSALSMQACVVFKKKYI
jgi:hypothetical protein